MTTNSVKEYREHLKERLKNHDCPSPEEIAKVNIFERQKLMEEKTRELTDKIYARKEVPNAEQMDKFDHLAVDWVYSDELEWTGSLADKEACKLGGKNADA